MSLFRWLTQSPMQRKSSGWEWKPARVAEQNAIWEKHKERAKPKGRHAKRKGK